MLRVPSRFSTSTSFSPWFSLHRCTLILNIGEEQVEFLCGNFRRKFPILIPFTGHHTVEVTLQAGGRPKLLGCTLLYGLSFLKHGKLVRSLAAPYGFGIVLRHATALWQYALKEMLRLDVALVGG